MLTRSLSLQRRFSTAGRHLKDAVIVSAVRTPIGSISGSLASLTGPQLGAIAITGALERAGLKAKDVDEVLMGCVVSAGVGQAPARQASMYAGLPESVCCTTINKVCASGMKAVIYAAQSVVLGHQGIVVAGGFESMSSAPYLLPNARAGLRYGHSQVVDAVIRDALWDPYNDIHMGMCAENTAAVMGISRQEQDDYAVQSYRRAEAAAKAGYHAKEIVPVSIKDKKGGSVVVCSVARNALRHGLPVAQLVVPVMFLVQVTADEEIAKVSYGKIAGLRAAFKKDGTVTAANASKLNDGAAALVITSAERAEAMGLKPLARIRGYADAEHAPIDFPTAPAKAVPIALARAGVTAADCHFHEINEAFALVALANTRLLGLDPARVNVHGGAVSLGHPVGCSGARIIGTLLAVLQQRDATLGTASICNGGGGASAVVIERLR